MSPPEPEDRGPRAEPLPAPIPGPQFKRITHRQSVIAWTLGSIAGVALAAGVILGFVLRVI